MMMCYENSCRMCLKGLEGPGINCIDISELQDSLRDLFEIEITRTDTTTSICGKCFDHVMSFKALKKTVQECQKLIKDYELIRKKICENRVTVKQEIIDLSSVKIEPGTSTQINRRTGSFSGSVTDSQINDVLNTIHDKRPQSVYIPNPNKRLKLQNGPIKCEPRTQTMTEIFIIPDDDDDEEITVQSTNKPIPQTENANQIISSTSRQVRPLNGTVVGRSSSSSRASTSNALPTQNNAENQISQKGRRSESMSSTAKSISEDVNVTTMNKTSNDLGQTIFAQEKMFTSTPNNAKPQSTNSNTASNKQSALNTNTKETKVQNTSTTKSIANGEERKRSSRARDLALKKKAIEQSAEMNGEGTDSEDNASISGRSLSRRVAKSQALRRISVQNKVVKDANEALKQGETTKTVDKSTDGKIANNPLNKNKRIITITLLRTKESINFKYCDQFKNTIDFNTVTDDEIKEIRGSLLMPDVWNNLRDVFKSSPPDAKTLTQLQKIFGAKFNFNVL